MKQDLPLSKLKLLKRNPRRITSSQMAKLCESLREDPEFLQKRPVLVNLVDGVYQVYAGNQRVRAARKLGWKTIPCDVDENLTPKLMRDRVLKDNKPLGEFDYDIICADYDVEELIRMGWTPEELSVDPEVIAGNDPIEEETQEKENLCPNCGCNLKEAKKSKKKKKEKAPEAELSQAQYLATLIS